MKLLAKLFFADKVLCDDTVACAKVAWPGWAETSPVKRARILFKFRELLEKYQNDLASLITKEHGKTLSDAQGSVLRAIEAVEFYCGLVNLLKAEFSVEVSSQMDCYTQRQSLGVCAGVSPFNFPVMVPIWMLIPAIACGNTFILKPSEQDPSATVRLFELLADAGLPAGVANCLQGDKTTVDQLLEHPDVVAFTAVASSPVAKAIYMKAIAEGKRAHTFGGAKNHAVVMPDADVNEAASAIVGAAFGSAGERCMAISVVVTIGDATADELLKQLIPLVQAIRIKAGSEAEVDMGPLISQAHKQRVLAAIDQGVAEGAQLLIDGRLFQHPNYPRGFFIGPSLFDHVNASMSIYQNEIFGPVLALVRVANLEEAIKLVNENPYGNGTAIFTRDGYTAREYSQRIQVGMVGINVSTPVPIVSHSFGGWKQSVFGDVVMHSTESVNFYTRRKMVTSKWPRSDTGGNRFSMPVNQ